MAGVTKEDIQAMIEESVGKAVAEVRAESEAKAKEEENKAPEEPKRKYANPFSGTDIDPRDIRKEDKGLRAARFMRYLAGGKGDPGRAASMAKKAGDEYMAKALNESVFEAGGALVPEDFMAEVIELLRAATVVRAAGASTVPMPRGSISMPYQATSMTASYEGELANAPPSQPSFGQLVLSAKKLTGLVPISNDLLRDAASSPAVDALVRDDMVQSFSRREDLAFIRGDGASNTPKGMLNLAIAANKFAASGGASPSASQISSDLHDLMLKLEDLNIPMSRAAWIMAPRTASAIMRSRDSGDNGYLFRDEMRGGTLNGLPFFKTTSIPTNLGGGTDESELYLADFASLVIGDAMSLEVSVHEGGAYHDGTGVVSGISTDQTVVKGISRHDFGARQRGQEIAVLTGVQWGS